MPSNQTPNYALNQWSRDDRVLMEDFNADNAKIDTALAKKAEQSALTALTQTVAALPGQIPRIVTGTYTGDGAAERFLSLPFTPKVVYLCTGWGAAFVTSVNHTDYLGGLIVTNGPLSASGTIYGQIAEGGVQLYHKIADGRTHSTNRENTKYHYIALSW